MAVTFRSPRSNDCFVAPLFPTMSKQNPPNRIQFALLVGLITMLFSVGLVESHGTTLGHPVPVSEEDPTGESIGESHEKKSSQNRMMQQDDETGSYVYSKIATIVPDPLLTANEDEKKELQEKFGKWHFWDGEEDIRPSQTDYCAAFKYRDIPGDELPQDAWQEDAVFVNHILNDGEQLVARAMEAIFTDYGRGKPLPPEGFSQRSRMFHTDRIDLSTQTTPPPDYEPHTGKRLQGGWTTDRSYEGLVRRLLHAMNTNDEFVVVLGGDAASAGHANHFRQSYSMQFHRIMAPILARMGVKLVTRNMAMGHGLGTVQSSLGFSSLYGQDIDMLIWDSAMTEPNATYAELFFRQGLMSSGKQGKIPYCLVGANSNEKGLFGLLRMLHEEAGVDVGQLGTSLYSVPATTSAEQAEMLPESFRYVICEGDAHALCKEHAHCTHCWIDRDDIPDPKSKFPHLETTKEDGGNSKDATQRWWYPSYRHHSIMGRNLAYVILDALQDGIERWSSGTMGGPPLDDDEWHVTEMYDSMKAKVERFLADTQKGECSSFGTEYGLPSRICSTPLRGVTEHTPRIADTSITNLVAGDNVPSSSKVMEYEGEDVHNQCLDAGDVDVVQVVSMRRRMLEFGNQTDPEIHLMPPEFQSIHETRVARESKSRQQHDASSRSLQDQIQPGKGWTIHSEMPGQCDGEYHSICGREKSDPCPLLGYHDARGEIVGNDACGWLVLDLPELKEGIVMIKYAFYESATKSSNRRLRQRRLASLIPDDENFVFEFAIDGVITTWKKQELLDHTKTIHKRMDIVTLLDKEDFTAAAKTVQVAIRVKGCVDHSCVFALSHLYWA